MNQIVHIFRKDVRQLRLEILATLAVMVLFDIFEPRSWANSLPGIQTEQLVSAALTFLLVIAWGILIIRLIQADRLPGVNQFWTTRPVVWWKLLAAKGLFLLCFLYAPLMLSQMVLLHLGGFSVASNLPLILLDMLLLSAMLVLPLAGAAAVTISFGQTVLALLGTLVLLVLFVAFAMGRNLEPRFLASLQLGIVVAILSGAVVYQYRWRATRNAIVLCAVTALLLISTQFFLPGSSLAVVGYDRPAQGEPVSIAIDTTPHPKGNPYNSVKSAVRTVILKVPLDVSGIAPGTSFSMEGQKVHLEGPDGTIWESHWENANAGFGQTPFSGTDGPATMFVLPGKVYERLQGGTVSMRMEFAVAQLQDMPTYQTILSTESEMVPGLGSCSLNEEWSTINCRSVFGEPSNYTVKTFKNSGACGVSPNDIPASGQIGVGSTGESRMTHGISPVTLSMVNFGPPGQRWGRICAGTPITFAGKRVVRRLQMQTATATVSLKDLAGF